MADWSESGFLVLREGNTFRMSDNRMLRGPEKITLKGTS
jgi:hypothetical protein